MKAKNTVIGITIAAVLFAFSAEAAGKHKKPHAKKPHPMKPAKPGKPAFKPRPVVLKPTQYSGRAVAVNLSNVVNGAVLHVADTGPLPSCGGSLEVTVGSTNIDLLSLDAARATTSGIGGVAASAAEVQNFSATFIHEEITNVIAFAYASAESRAECTATGVVLSATSQVQGLTIDGTNVVVTGEPNQTIGIAAGNIVLNAQVSTLATNCNYGEVSVAAIYLMLTDSFEGPIAFAESDIKCGSRVPPADRACGKLTGGGFIGTAIVSTNEVSTNVVTGSHASFGLAGGIKRGQFWGRLNYIDHGTGMHVVSSAVTGFTAIDTVTRQIDYEVTIDGVAGTAQVIAADNGEPGRNDIFQITLSTGYSAGGTLGGGNIQLHKCPPGWAR